MDQKKVDELVERFYHNLTQNSYFRSMFAERNVDIDALKARQKSFIARLLTEEAPNEKQAITKHVQERHNFHITSEHAKLWFSIMEQTVNEMELADEVKDSLLSKIRFLTGRLIEK